MLPANHIVRRIDRLIGVDELRDALARMIASVVALRSPLNC
jgi:hypothetical protein